MSSPLDISPLSMESLSASDSVPMSSLSLLSSRGATRSPFSLLGSNVALGSSQRSEQAPPANTPAPRARKHKQRFPGRAVAPAEQITAPAFDLDLARFVEQTIRAQGDTETGMTVGELLALQKS